MAAYVVTDLMLSCHPPPSPIPLLLSAHRIDVQVRPRAALVCRIQPSVTCVLFEAKSRSSWGTRRRAPGTAWAPTSVICLPSRLTSVASGFYLAHSISSRSSAVGSAAGAGVGVVGGGGGGALGRGRRVSYGSLPLRSACDIVIEVIVPRRLVTMLRPVRR